MTLNTRQRRIASLAGSAAISIASFWLLFAATSALTNEFLRHGEFVVSSRIVHASPMLFVLAYASSSSVFVCGIAYRRAANRKPKGQQNRPQRRRRVDPALSILC